jgi:hypothetical protein
MKASQTELLLDQHEVDYRFADMIASQGQQEASIASMLEGRAYLETVLNELVPTMDEQSRMTAVVVGGAALGYVRDKYGFDEYSPKLFSGTAEQDVLATFHHAGHSRRVVRDMLRYAVAVNEQRPETYTHNDLAKLAIIGSFHDTVMGNKRGTDERQSGKFANQYLRAIGGLLIADPEIQIAIEASTWDEKAMTQSYNPVKGYTNAQLAMCSGDHMSTLEPNAPYISITLAPEDASRKFNDQILTRAAKAAGFSLIGATIEDCLDFMDSNDTLRTWYGNYLGSNITFMQNFQPADPELPNIFPTTRQANVAHMRDMHERYLAREIGAVDTLILSRDYMMGHRSQLKATD